MMVTRLILRLVLVCSVQLIQGQELKPNIILIMTDDMGYGDLGIHENPDVQTPVLDKLSLESVSFNNFYVSPVCAPTRASLMTGRYHTRTGVFDTYSGGAIMASNEVTLAEILRDNGYTTGLFGKWHLGDSYPSRPQDQGFTHSTWHLSGGIGQVGDVLNYEKGNRSYFDPVLFKNGAIYESKGYCSDVFTEEAIAFIKDQKNTPFFAYLSFNAPHTPLQVPESYYDQYKDMEPDPEFFRTKGYYTHDMSDHDVESTKRVYAMISNIDDNLGRLFAALKQEGLYDNTIIIFLTDNGPQQNRFTGGFRGRKGQVREGGIHVPFYLKLQNSEFKSKQITTRAAHIDVLPTILSLCNLDVPHNLELDGISMASVIRSDDIMNPRPLFFEWQRSFPELYRNMTVFYGPHKLLANTDKNAPASAFELYNLDRDPYEADNISDENPEMVEELKEKLDSWHEDVIQSENMKDLPRITIGSEKETHTILNRNDARGMQLIWAHDNMHVRWDLTVFEDSQYDIICHFRKPIPNPGKLVLRFGTKNISKSVPEENVQQISLKNISLKKGETELDGWFLCNTGDFFTPFYLELIKKN
jgi:arylsulfatase A-like enzyme